MIALNEPKSWSRLNKDAAPTDDVPETDDAYEDSLVRLLGRLDDIRHGMLASRGAGRPLQVLQLAQELMELVFAFSERYCAFAGLRELEDAACRGNDFSAALADLRVEMQGSGSRSLLNGAKNESNAATIQASARRCFTSLYEAVFAYFVVFTSRFSTSRAARPWVEVGAMFVVELKSLASNPLPNG